MTLKEVCFEYGVTRRAVQGYEKNGLVAPTGRTARGYNLYDCEAQARILLIKRLQKFGFSLREVGEFLNGEREDKRRMLNDKLCGLEAAIERAEESIKEIRQMIDQL